MEMPQAVAIAIGFSRVELHNRWADHVWRPVAVAPAGSALMTETATIPADVVRDNLELRLFADEAENYLLNLTAPTPVLFVVWRMEDAGEPGVLESGVLEPTVLMVTASYGEAARMLDAGENVEGVPLPADLRGWIEDFARLHHQPPEKKTKNKRYASSRLEQASS